LIGILAEVLTVAPEFTAGIAHLPSAAAFYPITALLFGNRKAAFGIEASPYLVGIDEFLEIIDFA
jgi:hypothetical protein